MNLTLVGVSHHRAPLELRERVSVDSEAATALAAELASGCEAVVLWEDRFTEGFAWRRKQAMQLASKHRYVAAQMDALLTDINQAGLGRGLQFELFKPAAQERMADFYAELPISIRITGNYHDMGAFASDVAQLPRIVTLNDVAIQNDKGVLTLDAVAKTFRYLDEEEVSRQKKASKDKKAGAAAKPGGK